MMFNISRGGSRMKYAVIYYSETGNTKSVAERIYATIDSSDKIMVNLKEEADVPKADMYFVGFPIKQKNCPMQIVDALEQIESGKIVLFATCAMNPTEKYKGKLEKALAIWMPDDVEYLGMFLCQGRTTKAQKEAFYNASPEYKDKMKEMFDEGDYHPNSVDLDNAEKFVKTILMYNS
jgi:flavodoxin